MIAGLAIPSFLFDASPNLCAKLPLPFLCEPKKQQKKLGFLGVECAWDGQLRIALRLSSFVRIKKSIAQGEIELTGRDAVARPTGLGHPPKKNPHKAN